MSPQDKAAEIRPAPGQFQKRYGEWALVTGASDGIGREFARALAARQLNVVLVARRADRLIGLADELNETFAVKCLVVAADLATDEGRLRVLTASAPLDIGLLIAAAGFGTSGHFLAGPTATEQEMLMVNCAAVLEQCAHFGRRFATQGRGGIVLMSSLLAFQGTARSANYAATKAYIQTLAEGLREELGALGVEVVASAPGPVDTGFAERAAMRLPRALPPKVVAEQTLAALGRRSTVRPGWLSKLLGWSLASAPRPLRVLIMGRIMASMTAHQRLGPGADGRSTA